MAAPMAQCAAKLLLVFLSVHICAVQADNGFIAPLPSGTTVSDGTVLDIERTTDWDPRTPVTLAICQGRVDDINANDETWTVISEPLFANQNDPGNFTWTATSPSSGISGSNTVSTGGSENGNACGFRFCLWQGDASAVETSSGNLTASVLSIHSGLVFVDDNFAQAVEERDISTAPALRLYPSGADASLPSQSPPAIPLANRIDSPTISTTLPSNLPTTTLYTSTLRTSTPTPSDTPDVIPRVEQDDDAISSPTETTISGTGVAASHASSTQIASLKKGDAGASTKSKRDNLDEGSEIATIIATIFGVFATAIAAAGLYLSQKKEARVKLWMTLWKWSKTSQSFKQNLRARGSGVSKWWAQKRKWWVQRKKNNAKKQKAKKQEPKKQEPKKQEPKKQESKKQEPKKQEPKKEEPKKQENKKQEAKKEEPKKQETKKQEAKKEEPKKQEPKKEEPKKQEPKKQEPKKQTDGKK